jgi:hypothetical protein
MLHVEVSRMTGDPRQLADAVSYLTSEGRPAMERQPGNLGTSLLLDPEAGAMGSNRSGRRGARCWTARA